MRVTKLVRQLDGSFTAHLSHDGETVAVQSRYGSWQTTPDTNGVTHDVLPWAAAELQERATAVLAAQAPDEKEQERMNRLRKAALKALAMLGGRPPEPTEPEAAGEPAEVVNINAKRVAERMAAAARNATEGGDAA